MSNIIQVTMDPDRNLDACFETVMKLVDEAGAVGYNSYFLTNKKLINFISQIIALRNSGEKTVTQKSSDVDLLTETDQQVEKLLMDGLLSKFPSHK